MSMIQESIFTSPPISFILFFLLTSGFYWMVKGWAPKSEDQDPDSAKYAPYACGEDLPPERLQVSYDQFYRLALAFMVLHMAALVVGMLPAREADARVLAIIYLLGVAVCVDVLVRREG